MEKNGNVRLAYLDSLRGIASLSVVFYHWIGGFQQDVNFLSKDAVHWWSMLFNGSDAVSFFFVLSGLVLSFKYFHGSSANQPIDFKSFVIARCYRLYPAFWISLIFYYLYSIRHGGIKVFNSLSDLVAEASLFRNFTPLYGAGWTLNVELVLSMIVPFLILLIRYNEKLFNYFMVLSVFMTAFFSSFLLHFSLGIFLAYHFIDVSNFNFKESKYYRYRWLIAVLTILAYSIRHIYSLFPFTPVYEWLRKMVGLDFFQLTGLASFIIITWVINNRSAQQFLNRSFFRFLGEISYGMYLVHWFWLFYILNPRFRTLQNWFGTNDFQTCLIIGALLLALTIGTSVLLYRFIEIPWIKRGRKRIASLK